MTDEKSSTLITEPPGWVVAEKGLAWWAAWTLVMVTFWTGAFSFAWLADRDVLDSAIISLAALWCGSFVDDVWRTQ